MDEILETQITKDTGSAMIGRAMEAITDYVLNPAWKDQLAFAAGTQLSDVVVVIKCFERYVFVRRLKVLDSIRGFKVITCSCSGTEILPLLAVMSFSANNRTV